MVYKRECIDREQLAKHAGYCPVSRAGVVSSAHLKTLVQDDEV